MKLSDVVTPEELLAGIQSNRPTAHPTAINEMLVEFGECSLEIGRQCGGAVRVGFELTLSLITECLRDREAKAQ